MFFCVCEHYDDNQSIIKENSNECFICFEYKTHDENIPTSLQKQKIYLNNCTCNGSIHNYCLKIWFNKHKSCPICRINVVENNNATIIFYNYIPYGIRIYIFIKKLSIRFLRFFSVILFLYAFIDFSINIIKTRYIPHNDCDYIPIPILQNKNFDEHLNELN